MKVNLIAYTENADELCARAAATCTQAKAPEKGSEKALMTAIKSGHESVLEHASFTFMVEGVSRALTHQLVRHRVASYTQASQRFINMDNFDYVVPDTIKNNPSDDVLCNYRQAMSAMRNAYHALVMAGVPEEDARYVLPNACCTNIVVTMNARELRHFFGLRCCCRAQREIKELADAMLQECRKVAPLMFASAGAQCKQLGYCPEVKSCGKRPKFEEMLDSKWLAYQSINKSKRQLEKVCEKDRNSEEKVQKNNTFSEEKVQKNNTLPTGNVYTYGGIMEKLDDIMDRMTVYDWAISNGYIPARKKEKMKDE